MYAYTQRHVSGRYTQGVRALVDIQDSLYPRGYRRPGRTPNIFRSYRLGNVALPTPIDEGYDSDEAMCHKRMHIIMATRAIRRLVRNVWVKRKWRRLLYFLCWVCKRKSEYAKPLAKEEITNIAE